MGKTTINKFLFISLSEYQLLSHLAMCDESISMIRVSDLKKSDIEILNKLINRKLCRLAVGTTHYDDNDVFTCIALEPYTLELLRTGFIHPTFFKPAKFTFWIGYAAAGELKHKVLEVASNNYLSALDNVASALCEARVLPIYWETHCLISASCEAYNIYK